MITTAEESRVPGPVDSESRVPGPVDYSLHGVVGIRLIDAGPNDAAAVTRQLGPIRGSLDGEPDVVIRFVDRLETSSPLCTIGVDEAGFTDDAFLVLRSKHKTRSRVQIPLERIGRRCEIVCERGLAAVPLLIAIVNLTALAKGVLPMHASAFTYRGTGILVTGWSKGGKTETLLGFLANGAQYVGDEWVYLTEAGRSMMGIPEPIRVWDWHLEDLPQFRALLRSADRTRLRALGLAVRSLRWSVAAGTRCGLSPVKGLERFVNLLERQRFAHLPPRKFFRHEMGPLVETPEKVFFVVNHELPDVTVRRMDPQEIARRMVYSLQEERADLMSWYRKFRFAFPDAPNRLLERAGELEAKLLTRALQNKEAYAVYHPYPVSIPLLFDAISPYCRRTVPHQRPTRQRNACVRTTDAVDGPPGGSPARADTTTTQDTLFTTSTHWAELS